ncbi:flagellum-associated coiled-coil domain-containing protein 1-like isoform X1 [Ochotona curzoniae]|uniref:flagellum-associated coiled-coil domain-containing protein 1-like isoform X1 n=1 Tax=Ochotona curzoniae TaxID=130825 RepID=UPI001B352D43|nr:flagellum-associated coiled-coil domain-containing protein 1-like isoform X1 [Ochotona curzoniae]XP_040853811.1 flagellum-associated coiled-coil domain-containing protein 1-like isoform X1 [Ochotona curzoniae]
MYPNPLIYCTCWDPWNLGPRKLIKTPHPPSQTAAAKTKLVPLLPASKDQNYVQPQPATKPIVNSKLKIPLGKQEDSSKPYEVINVSPGYQLIRNREQISVTLGDEMFGRKKPLDSEVMDKAGFSRTNIIHDLEEQISELTAIIEQMNRDHQCAQKLLANEMELRFAEMEQDFQNKNRELREAHKMEVNELENNYKASLKAEKAAAQEKIEEMRKEYKYLKNMFHMYQDSIYDEMEDKWSKRKAEWEKDEKIEREKILLQQKHKMTKKFELESEEEKKKIYESYVAAFENFMREKEGLLKQHENDTLQLEELRKTKEIIEEELHAQTLVLESLNMNLCNTQMELQKEKAAMGHLEKTLQIKLAEAEDKYKYTIQLLTEENIHLRQKIIAKNEEIYEGRCGKSADSASLEDDLFLLEGSSSRR